MKLRAISLNFAHCEDVKWLWSFHLGTEAGDQQMYDLDSE